MKTLPEYFIEIAEKHAGRIAVADPSASLTYARLAACAAGVAEAIAATERDFVAIAMPSCAAFPAAYFGVLLAGKTPVPLNFLQEPATLAAIAADAGFDTIITVGPLAEPMRKLAPHVLCAEAISPAAPRPPARGGSFDALATLLYTSGTAGPPKGVMLTHRNLVSNVESSVGMAEYTHNDVSFGPLPLFHAFGITCTMLLPLLNGATALFIPKFVPAAALKLIAENRVTCIFAVPSIYRLLVQAAQGLPREQFASLRFCVAGGEALGNETAEGFERAFGRPLMQGYGLTEASPVVSLNPPYAVRRGSVGVPLPWAEVQISDAAGLPLPAGTQGELLIRGACVMRGYRNNPDATRSVIDAAGWLHTGDLATRDTDGYLHITGRAKEMIISAGENISPGEIEAAINSHPAVLESAVIALADAARGEVPQAFVALRPGAQATEAEIIEHCRALLSRTRVPRQVTFRTDLPHTLTGKILKRALK